MNIKEYIESGILEAYALGALSEEERIKVEADLAMYPELVDELSSIEQAMQAFAESHSEEPPSHLQDKIWDAISEQQEPEVEYEAVEEPSTKEIQLPTTTAKQPSMLRAAIWAAVLVSVATNFILLSQRNQSREDTKVLTAKVDSLSAEQSEYAAVLKAYNEERAFLANPATVAVKMNSMKDGMAMNGMIFWNKEKKEAYLALNDLPMPPDGKQYQLWVIQDGKPVDMGMIPNTMVAEKGMMKVGRAIASGQAFAISLENEGGSPSPTMEEIHVLGAVNG
ncbi:MAG: anti-sigma factor [Chitinophagales bacterium]|nr:anti-sigma factor [Chitinophagaceae bacterium]MCB9065038.1 anti-sigma factor [Chitinophagales bacterium]